MHELSRIPFFFHPATWLARKRWEEAMEQACDRALVASEQDSFEYAERLHSLAGIVCRGKEPILAHGLSAARTRVGRRIEVLLQGPRGSKKGLSRTRRADALRAVCGHAQRGAGLLEKEPPRKDFEFAGIVHLPDGKPAEGAQVLATVFNRNLHRVEVIAQVTAGADGRFAFGYDKQDVPFNRYEPNPWTKVTLSAHLGTHGIDAWKQADLDAYTKLEFRLGEDAPLEGTLVDEDGRPLAGATVRLVSTTFPASGSLDEWQKKLEEGGLTRNTRPKDRRYFHFPKALSPRAKTDADGRFAMHGVGRDRMAWVQMMGGDAAYGHVRMVTRALDEALLERANVGNIEPVHCSGSIVVGRRTRPVEGVVVDGKTGEPMADVGVFGYAIEVMGMGMLDDKHTLRTRTDEAGRFQLLGMPKGKRNAIIAVPNDEQPYLMREVRLPDPAGMEPIELEIELVRGI